VTDPGPLPPITPQFVMVGDADAAVCADDSCLLPGAVSDELPDQTSAAQITRANESGSS
jgi:hypothetical protein